METVDSYAVDTYDEKDLAAVHKRTIALLIELFGDDPKMQIIMQVICKNQQTTGANAEKRAKVQAVVVLALAKRAEREKFQINEHELDINEVPQLIRLEKG